MKIPVEMLKNRAYASNAVMFNTQLSRVPEGPGREKVVIPPAIEVQEDGSAVCRFYAPTAQTVTVGLIRGEQMPLTKGEDGIWTGRLTFAFPGTNTIIWIVDGVEVLNPYAPVVYGYGHPCNYIDVPCVEHDFLMLNDVPHGSVVREYFKSSVTGEYESCMVYLPPCYHEDTERRYPVLYLQHGGIQNETCWVYEAKINFMMDNLLAKGEAVPFIIVMNNGCVNAKNENGEWFEDYNKLQDLLLKDCIPFIDKRYRTLTDAWNRAYAGLSMGSLQGGRFFMENQDVVASAGLFSGYKYPPQAHVDFLVKQDYLSALDDAEKFNAATRLFFLAVGADEPSLVKVEQESRECTEKGIKHIFRSYPGEHEWHVWRAAAHDFFKLVFND